MANIASQKKRILRTERERLENRRLTTVVKTRFRNLEAAVEEKLVLNEAKYPVELAKGNAVKYNRRRV